MTLTTYSNNKIKEWKETYLLSLKKSRGMMALLALLLFMAMPMIFLIGLSDRDDHSIRNLNNSFSEYLRTVVPFLVTPLILIFVGVIAVLLFNYMHQKRRVDLFHSLPIGRTPMLLGRYFAGLTTLVLPIILNFSIVLIIGLAYQIDMVKALPLVISYMLWLILMSAAALTFSVFIAVCSGTTLDMVLSILGINAAYPLLIFLGGIFATSLLPGLNISTPLNSTLLSALAPFVAAFIPYFSINSYMRININSSANSINIAFILWWVIFTLILLAGSILIYRKRKSECAESNFTFSLPKTIIRFIITAAVGLGCGLVLGISTDAPLNFFIGLISGSLAAHIVVESIYSRGFKQLKKSFIYYGGFVATFVVAYAILSTGCFGYDTMVPDSKNVASITIDTSFSQTDHSSICDENSQPIAEITPTLKEKSNIDEIVNLHKKFVTDLRKKTYPYCITNFRGADSTITYHLKNGKTIKRSYFENYTMLNLSSAYSHSVDKLISSKEFRETSSILFYLEPEYIKSVDLTLNKNHESLTFAPNLNTKKELIEALKQDYLDGNANEGYDDSYRIRFEYKNPISPKDGKLKTYLNGYSDKVTLYSTDYHFHKTKSKTTELIKKLGWNK